MFGGQMRKPVRWNYLGVLTLRNCRSNSNAIPICSFSNPQVCWDVCRNTIHNKSLIQFDHICWWNPSFGDIPWTKSSKTPPSPPLWSRSPATASDAPAPTPPHWCAPQGAASPGDFSAQKWVSNRHHLWLQQRNIKKKSGKNIQEDMLWYSLIWYSYLKKLK